MYPPPSELWHPILTAQEAPTGTWSMVDPHGIVYGIITIRRRGDHITYRCEYRGELLGWASTLRLATLRLAQANVPRHPSSGPPRAYPRAE